MKTRQADGSAQSEVFGAQGRLGAVAGADLAQDHGHVVFDRSLDQRQPVGDLPIGEAARNQLEDLLLAFREGFWQACGGGPGRVNRANPATTRAATEVG